MHPMMVAMMTGYIYAVRQHVWRRAAAHAPTRAASWPPPPSGLPLRDEVRQQRGQALPRQQVVEGGQPAAAPEVEYLRYSNAR